MNPESARQFLMDLGLNRSQPEDQIRTFREWQHQATPEELAALDQWHQQWLMQQKEKLDAEAGMLDRNRAWLERQVLASIQYENHALGPAQDRSRTPVKYMLRWVAAAVFIGVITTGIYFSLHRHPSETATAIPREGLTAGAVLTLSDGHQVSLESIPIGATIADGDLRIVKRDSVTLSYDHQPIGEKNGHNSLTTSAGEEYCVVLPDSSQVWLNSRATLTYPTAFTSPDRTVQLSGEAYFEIRRDPSAPFTVKAPGMDVQVLGTSFDMMAYPEEASVRTTLVDGSIAVKRRNETKVLQPGEQAQVSTGIADSTAACSVVKADMEEVLAWRHGEFRFKRASIKRVMRQIARWYDVTVNYSGPLPTASFSGVITRKETVTQLLEGLEISGDVHFIVSGKNITVIAGPR